MEIVFRHGRYNRYEYMLVPFAEDAPIDILIVNPFESDGLRALARVRGRGHTMPVVTAVPRGATASTRHAIAIERLTLQLLPMLNRVVELEFESPVTRPQVFRRPTPNVLPADTVVRPEAMSRQELARPLPTAEATPPIAAAAVSHTTSTASAGGSAERVRERDEEADDEFPSTVFPPTAFPPTVPAERVPPLSIRSAPQAQPLPTPSDQTAQAEKAEKAGESRPDTVVAFPRSARGGVERIDVLVVDDSPTVRRQLAIALNRMGIECTAVASAAAALEQLERAYFELVLVDVMMPEMDGYRLTREIRRLHRGTPVIILTSKSSPFDLARGALAGCSSFLVKPVPLRKLEAAIVKQLRKSLAIDDLASLLRPSAGLPGSGGRGEGARSGRRVRR